MQRGNGELGWLDHRPVEEVLALTDYLNTLNSWYELRYLRSSKGKIAYLWFLWFCEFCPAAILCPSFSLQKNQIAPKCLDWVYIQINASKYIDFNPLSLYRVNSWLYNYAIKRVVKYPSKPGNRNFLKVR